MNYKTFKFMCISQVLKADIKLLGSCMHTWDKLQPSCNAYSKSILPVTIPPPGQGWGVV